MRWLIAPAIGLAAIAGVALWLARDPDWEARARDHAAELAAPCKPRCVLLPLQEVDDRRWRIRFETPGELRHCFLVQTDERNDRNVRRGLSPCGAADGGRWWRDWRFLRTYRPAQEIARLGGAAGLSQRGRKLFYVGDPKIVRRRALSRWCGTGRTADLHACITEDGRIYIARVSRADLRGLMTVAAAHEMLHAAYERLPALARKDVDRLIQKEGELAKQEIRSQLASYTRKQKPSELHSILGTEYAKLSRPLQEHYARYFAARQRTVIAYSKFKSVFDEVEGELAAAAARVLKIRNQADARRRAGDIAGYNALVEPHNAAVREFDRKRREYAELQRSLTE